MEGTPLDYVPFVAAWLGTLYKLPAFLQEPRDPGRRLLWLTLLSVAVAVTVLLPPMYVTFDRWSQIPNLARLVGDALLLIACWLAQQLLRHLDHRDEPVPRRILQHWAILVVALILLTGIFISGSATDEALNFIGRYGGSTFFLEYELVFLGYLGLTMANVAVRSWQFAAVATPPSLSVGLRTVTVGAGAGVLFALHQVLYGLSMHLGFGYPVADPARLARVLAAIAVGAIVIGSTMPAWGAQCGIPSVYRWLAMYRSLRRLYPLWLALCRAAPQIALSPPSGKLADLLTVRDLEFRLYRRVIEIRDGWLALRPYFDPEVAHLAAQLAEEAGLDDVDTVAVVDAALLRAAIAARDLGERREHVAHDLPAHGGADIAEEVAVLERLACHFQGSSIVQAAVERTGVKQAKRPARMAGTE